MPSMLKNKEINVQDVKRGNEEFTQPQSVEQVARIGYQPDFVSKESDASDGRIERVLDQLACRVGRIEAFCLRFEVNLLKPLGNIEARLQRVEQQLEVLTERTQSPKLNLETETTATGCSSDKSDTNSHHNAGNEDAHCCTVSEFSSKDTTCTRSMQFPCGKSHQVLITCGMLDSSKDSIPFSKASSAASSAIDDASDSVIVSYSHPSLIVTAPEFSDDEEDGIGHGSGCEDEPYSAEVVCPIDKPSSLDNALASALAGFLSSTSFLPSKVYHPVTAKDFKSSGGDSCEENSVNKTISQNKHDNKSSMENANSGCDSVNQLQKECTQEKHPDLTPNGFVDNEMYGTDPTNKVLQVLTMELPPILSLLQKKACDRSVDSIFIRDIVESDLSTVIEVHCVGSNENGLEAMLSDGFISSVDFELPILDVKFDSWKDNITCSLEILTDIPETKIEEVPCVEEAHDNFSVNGQGQLFAKFTASDIPVLDDLHPANNDATSKVVFQTWEMNQLRIIQMR